MNREWWIPIVQWTLWGLVMALVMGWLARSRMRERLGSERQLLVHPTSILVTGIVGAVFSFGLAIVSNTIGKNETTTIWTTLVFVAFGLLGVALIADYIFTRYRVSEEGMEYGGMFGQRGVLQWSEVRSVRYAPFMRWFVLQSASGTKVRMSAMLVGLPEFARLALRHVPKAAIDEATLEVLRETEQGRLPSV